MSKKNLIVTNITDKIQVLKPLSTSNLKKAINYFSKHGILRLIKKIKSTLSANNSYICWFKIHKTTSRELELQNFIDFIYKPKISIIVPTFKTPNIFLEEMLNSMLIQSYSNWELCIADGSDDERYVKPILEKYSKLDNRIKYIILKENLGISGNTNVALSIASGDYIGLLDHDDVLAPNALFEIVREINSDISIDIIYTDEDKITSDAKVHFQPNFKPDFNLDLLRSCNYICHFFVVKKSIVNSIGGFRSEFDGSQDYDFIFKCIEKSSKIKHIPKVLYHWRMHPNSVAQSSNNKLYAYDAGKEAISSHLRRMNIEAKVNFTDYAGIYRVKYSINSYNLVSIIIPNKDNINILKRCIESIQQKTTYLNYELIIVENNSKLNETFIFYESLKVYSNIKILYWEDKFNYSKINNYGVENSNGDYVILLNNDTEVISPDWIEEMLSNCQRVDVGVVGVKLLYPNNTIQHAGIILGLGGIAGHIFVGADKEEICYGAKAIIQQNYSAVTGACLMIKKSLYFAVGGLDENLPYAYNDVDLCLRVREFGLLVVYNPFVTLYHYESLTRGNDEADDKKRLINDSNYIRNKWENIFASPDQYYNINLSLDKPDCSLKF